jgi:hypothetical protein
VAFRSWAAMSFLFELFDSVRAHRVVPLFGARQVMDQAFEIVVKHPGWCGEIDLAQQTVNQAVVHLAAGGFGRASPEMATQVFPEGFRSGGPGIDGGGKIVIKYRQLLPAHRFHDDVHADG